MAVLLGLLAAVCYGTSDFAGGFASRRFNAVTILCYSYPLGALLSLAVLPALAGPVDRRVVIFAVLGGLAGLLGVIVLYQLMVVAPINVVSPVSAVLAAIVPVGVGVAIGERPSVTAWIGIVVGLLAVVLVSRTSDEQPHHRVTARIVALACLAGVGFGLYFVFLDRAGHASGLWPLAISRVTAAVLIQVIAAGRRAYVRVTGRTLAITALAGICDTSANLFFLLAARHGLLSVAAVLTSLYPGVTVLLAIGLLRERMNRVQVAGLGLAAAAVVLVTV